MNIIQIIQDFDGNACSEFDVLPYLTCYIMKKCYKFNKILF